LFILLTTIPYPTSPGRMQAKQLILAAALCALSILPERALSRRIWHDSTRTAWSRAELSDRLAKGGYFGDLTAKAYNRTADGLLWTGSSWWPGRVFANGFKKTVSSTGDDPGDNISAWGQQIARSISANGWAYGFHTSVNPRVAAQFGVFHAAMADLGHDSCDEHDHDCVRELMGDFQSQYGCPATNSSVWQVDETCWGGPCIRADKLTDYDEGLDDLCPNWGYAYLLRVEGIHARVSISSAVGKDYAAEEEVFVPIGIEPEEIIGAIPIYVRKEDGSKRNPGLINFQTNWNVFKALQIPGAHTLDGAGSSVGIGAFIHNPRYKGDGQKELIEELEKKKIAGDLGTAVPKEMALM